MDKNNTGFTTPPHHQIPPIYLPQACYVTKDGERCEYGDVPIGFVFQSGDPACKGNQPVNRYCKKYFADITTPDLKFVQCPSDIKYS